jgi:hypothetical protein
MNRRTFLRAGVAATAAAAVPGFASVAASASVDRTAGVVWSKRDQHPKIQRHYDITRRADGSFLLSGLDTADGENRAFVRLADSWGRSQTWRKGSDENEWGDWGYEVIARESTNVLVGVADDAPKLVGFTVPPHPEWTATFDGTPAGAVHATQTDGGLAVGWTEADGGTATVVGTDEEGTEEWSRAPGDERTLSELLTTDSGSVVAVGTVAGDAGSAWATVWDGAGSQLRDETLDVPGEGPFTATADGDAVVLAGTTDEDWWLQRRSADWSVDWTQTYDANGSDHDVDDVVARDEGYGLLGHDSGGAVVVRVSGDGSADWRGQYAPYTDDGPAERGHAMVPVDGDQFVVAGTTHDGDEGDGWWWARVGDPAVATPNTPEPTPTPGPTTTPAPQTTEGTPTTESDPGTTLTTTGGTDVPTTATTEAESATGTSTSSSGPGFGLVATLAGLSGWVAMKRRGND